VNLQTRVRTPQFRALPFAVRAGLHIAPEEQPHDVKPTHEEDSPQ
jgi:hypothetical protein